MEQTKYIAGSDLTMDQKRTAATLRMQRPMCVPGTNAIILQAEADLWHAKIANAATELDIRPAQEKAFFDACGVAD